MEYKQFLHFLGLIIDENVKKCGKGVPFMQIAHDDSTLDNKLRYKAIAVQLIDKDWCGNWALALCITQCEHHDAKSSADLMETKFSELLRRPITDVCEAMISDRGAISTGARMKDISVNGVCQMHDHGKSNATMTMPIHVVCYSKYMFLCRKSFIICSRGTIALGEKTDRLAFP